MGVESFSSWSELWPQISIFDKQELWAHRHEVDLEQATRKLIEGTPIEYILSKACFGPDQLFITEPLLIPRPGTYDWLQRFFSLIAKEQPVEEILELGVGTGAILCALSTRYPKAHLTGVDISDIALSVTKKNLLARNKKATLVQSHWFDNLEPLKQFDLIISNPPYCATEESFWMQGVDSEDHRALYSDHGGLKDLHQILKQSVEYLTQRGCLVLEHGAGQGPSVTVLGKFFGLTHWKKLFDEQGFWRATCLWQKK